MNKANWFFIFILGLLAQTSVENTNVIDGKCGLFGLIEIKDNGGKLVWLFEIMDTKQTLFTSVKYPEQIHFW